MEPCVESPRVTNLRLHLSAWLPFPLLRRWFMKGVILKHELSQGNADTSATCFPYVPATCGGPQKTPSPLSLPLIVTHTINISSLLPCLPEGHECHGKCICFCWEAEPAPVDIRKPPASLSISSPETGPHRLHHDPHNSWPPQWSSCLRFDSGICGVHFFLEVLKASKRGAWPNRTLDLYFLDCGEHRYP